MAHKLFFSWQSDVRSRAGRGLIEDSLKAAIKALRSDSELEHAQRDMEIDRDVMKTPGHPPLMEVIFDKITHAAIFVADMTYVGVRQNGKRTPNPNVLIEYGWALKAASWRRIVLVMNTSFGHPKDYELPFDLRHMLQPIMFECPEDADNATRAAARDALTKDLIRALKAIFEDETALAGMKPPAPAEAHAHDVELLQEVHRLLSRDTRAFLHQHNFGDAFPRAKLDPVYEIANWVSAAYEFHDREVEEGFKKLRAAIASFVEIALDGLYAMDRNPDMAWPLTDRDRANGIQPGTENAIKTLNQRATVLSNEIDAFDRLARDRIRIATQSSKARVEDADPREARADEALTEMSLDSIQGRHPVIVGRPRMILKLAPFGAAEGRRLEPAAVVRLCDKYPLGKDERAVKGSDARQWWVCGQPVHRNGLPNPESSCCMRIVRPGNIEYQETVSRRIDDDPEIVVDGRRLEGKVVHHLEMMANSARALGFDGPALVSVHFDGMTDVMLMRPGRGGNRMRDAEIGFGRLRLVDLRDPIAPDLREIFDILWQSGGWAEGSTSFPSGKWLGYEDDKTYAWSGW